MSSSMKFKISYKHGYYPIHYYKPNLTFKNYTTIHSFKHSSDGSYVHIGVGNPAGGWALRITESPDISMKADEMPEGIWVFPEQLEEFIASLRNTMRYLPRCCEDAGLRKSGFEMVEIAPMPSGNSPILFAVILIENAWLISIADARGNQLLLDSEESSLLIEAANSAKTIIKKKMLKVLMIPNGCVNALRGELSTR